MGEGLLFEMYIIFVPKILVINTTHAGLILQLCLNSFSIVEMEQIAYILLRLTG